MAVDKEALTELIVTIVRELGDQDQVELPQNLTPTTPLFGESGFLDSMSLVSLVVACEQAIEDKFGKSISLSLNTAFVLDPTLLIPHFYTIMDTRKYYLCSESCEFLQEIRNENSSDAIYLRFNRSR